MAELTFLLIMISVRSEIPLGMVQKLKGIVYPKRWVVLLTDSNDMQKKYLMLLLQS